MKNSNGVATATRAERRRWRRRRHIRRLMVVALMGVLCFAAGVLAEVLEINRDPEGGYSVRVARAVYAPGGASEEKRKYALPWAEKARLLASKTAQGPVEARGRSIHDEPADKQVSEETREGAEEHLDVLVLGVDRRPSASEGATSHSDTMMLVRVSPQTGRIRLLSVPRDLLIDVEPGVQDRINTAYLDGGTPLATEVMEELTGVTIDRYAIVDFDGFEDSIDALGGVTLEVEQPIRIGLDGRRVYIAPGRQELDGLEALAYARYRGTACGDLDRMKRQQRLVAALREEVLGWNTITRLPDIVRVMRGNVDTNLGVVQAISVGRALVGNGKVGGMRSYQLKGKPEILPNGDAVLVPDEQANERILEKFRGDGPARDSGQAERQPSKGSSSGC
jgi:polyisoprenyl-teichoic acid--peptidoglycan teichoic acid transferase